MNVINVEYSVDDEDYNFELEIPKDMDKDQIDKLVKKAIFDDVIQTWTWY